MIDIIEAHKNQQLCSLTGVEGGHSLGGSLAVLRTLYAIGVRYMTLTSTCHTPWADSSYADAPTFNVKHGGLTIFGKSLQDIDFIILLRMPMHDCEQLGTGSCPFYLPVLSHHMSSGQRNR
ncbi:hypothetical protein GQX74_001761 [Glossina fuscipes]|nr:hypothetical protein GQX74_001761 [Glossina fuscipes]